MKGTASRR